MGFFSCFSSSTKQDDPSEDHYKTAIKISKHVKEDSIVRRKREKAEQIETERAKEISLKAYEEEKVKRRLKESKEEGKREKVDDNQVGAEKTKIERENRLSLKLFEEKEEKRRLQESKEEGKRERVDDDQIEINMATEESLKQYEVDEEKRRLQESKEEGKRKQVEEDDKGQLIKHSNDQEVNPPSKCKDSKSEIKDGLSGNAFDGLLHPHCVCCLHCHKPFAVDEIPRKGKFHRSCYREHRTTCYVCQKKLPSTEKGRLVYNEHPFWKNKYCPCHDGDGTAKCCSCERLEPKGTNFVILSDDRWLCLQCIGSSVMDTDECIDLHVEIRDFFDGLFFKVEKEFPLLLVETPALNKAEKEEKIDYNHAVVTRGICLSEEQYVTSVKEGPKRGPNNTLINMVTVTETQMVSGCEVTAILIIYGLPRLLTGYILAHEMMHAYLRLNGYKNLKAELEEGLCQVLALTWLESHTFPSTDATAASSSNTPPAASTSKKVDDWSDFEKKLAEFCIHQIKEDDTPLYGRGFKLVHEILVSNHYSLKETLKDIVKASKSVPGSKF